MAYIINHPHTVGRALATRRGQLETATGIEDNAKVEQPGWSKNIPGVNKVAKKLATGAKLDEVEREIALLKSLGKEAPPELLAQLLQDREAIDDKTGAAFRPQSSADFLALLGIVVGAVDPKQKSEQIDISNSIADVLKRNEVLLDAAIANATSAEQQQGVLSLRDHYYGVRQKGFESAAASGGKGKSVALSMLATAMPMLPVLMLGGVNQLLDLGEVAYRALMMPALFTGVTAGEKLAELQRRAVKVGHAVRSIEAPDTLNEMARIHDLFSAPALGQGGVEDIVGRLYTAAIAADALFELRAQAFAENPRQKTQAETEAEAKLVATNGAFKALMERAGEMTPAALGKEITRIQSELGSAVKRKSLAGMESGIQPKRLLSGLDFKVQLNQLFVGVLKKSVDDFNQPLRRFLDDLEREHKYSAHLETGGGATKLNKVELATLKAMSGPKPSLPVLLALVPLVRSGALDLLQLWPNATEIKIPTGEVFDARKLVDDLVELERFQTGKGLQKLGKAVDNITRFVGGPLAFAGLFYGFGLPILWSMLGSIVTRIIGSTFGQKIKEAGTRQQMTEGLELLGGQPISTESEFLLERIARPASFLSAKTADELREALALEAQVIKRLVASFTSFVAQAGPGLEEATKLEAPLSAALGKFAEKLEALSQHHGDLAELRTQFLRERATLFTPELSQQLRTWVIRRSEMGDLETDPRRVLIQAKRKFMEGLKAATFDQTIKGVRLGNVSLDQAHQIFDTQKLPPARMTVNADGTRLFDLAKAVSDAQARFEARNGSNAPQRWYKQAKLSMAGVADEKHEPTPKLDELVKLILDKPYEPITLGQLIAPLETNRDTGNYKLVDQMISELERNWPITPKSVVRSTQELMEVISTQVLPVYAWATGDAPILKPNVLKPNVQVQNPNAKPHLRTYQVDALLDFSSGWKPLAKLKSKFKSDDKLGRVEATLDNRGLADPKTLRVDLGKAAISQIAAVTIGNYVDGLYGQKEREMDILSLKALEKDGGFVTKYRAELDVEGVGRVSLVVSGEGTPDLSSLAEQAVSAGAGAGSTAGRKSPQGA